jgi:uncharacterized membrane protein YfcA
MELVGSLATLDALIKSGGIALISGVVLGYSGFGGALFMVPLLSLFIEPANAVAATMIAAVIGQIPIVLKAARVAQWKECGPLLLASVITMPAGVYVLASGDPQFVRRMVGLGTIAMASVLLVGWTYRGNRSRTASAMFGALLGVFNGATGQGGPIAVAYFISANVEPKLQRANIVTAVMGVTVVLLVVMSFTRILTLDVMLFGLVLAVPFTLGAKFGSYLFAVIPMQNYRRVIIALLFVAGASALLR